MSYIFIGYSHEDSDFAEHLETLLHEQGFETWRDNKLVVGEQWRQAILKAVESCAAMVIVMSHRSEKSMEVMREFLHADLYGKRIFPILIDGDIWPILSGRQYEDMRKQLKPKTLPASLLLELH